MQRLKEKLQCRNSGLRQRERDFHDIFRSCYQSITRQLKSHIEATRPYNGAEAFTKEVGGGAIAWYLHRQFARHGSLQAIDHRAEQLILYCTSACPRDSLTANVSIQHILHHR